MLLFQKCVVLLIATSSCQSFGNDVTFLGLLPLYNFFSSQNRPVQHPALSLYESLNPTQYHAPPTPKISPLIPVYAFLNNFGLSQPEPTTIPTYVIPQPVITTDEPPPIEEESSTGFPIPSTITSGTPMTPTTTSRPPIPPPPRPPPPPLPPPLTSLVVQNIYDPQVNKTMRPLPLPKPSGGGYRPHRPIVRPPTPPPGFTRTSQIPSEEEEEEEEGNNVDEVNGMQDVSNKPHSHHRTQAYKYSSTQDGRVAYEVLS